jgi:uncharacterized protein YhaN
MRILELYLKAVGPFDGLSLDLSAGNKGLHLIYGPNEAGKSSALRALAYLFFGFPSQVDDCFLHPYPSLRVGARICDDHSEELVFVRRKAAKNSLRASDDSAPISEDVLCRFLGYIDQNFFKTFFGIDHAMLVRGGQDVVEGQGDVGKILFSGSGISELHAVQKNLDSEMQALFLPAARAKKPRLNDLLAKLETTRKTIRDCQLPHREWGDQHKTLERDLKRKQRAEEELQDCCREHNRLQRVQEALPLIASRTDLLARRADLVAVPTLPSDFRERRQKIEQTFRVHDSQRTRASSAFTSLNQKLDALDITESFLDERQAIEPISSRLGVYHQAQDDRPGLEAELRRLEEDAVQTLHKIDQSLELSDAASVQLPETQRNRIRHLGGRYDALAKDRNDSSASVLSLQGKIERERKRLNALPQAPDATSLRATLQQAMKLGDIEDQLAAVHAEHQSADEQLAIDLRQLPLWAGTPTELETLALPSTETIERFDTDLGALDQELHDLRRDIDGSQDDAEQLDRKIRHLRLEQDVPTEESLSDARRRREEGWTLIRRAWRDEEIVDEEVQGFLESLGKTHDDLTAGFEQAVERADDLADRLRREASRVTMVAELQAQRELCEERTARLMERLGQVEIQRRSLWSEWDNCWERAGIAPLSPREMLAWTRQHASLCQHAKTVRRLLKETQRLENRLDQHSAKLRDEIEAVSTDALDLGASLHALINEADHRLAIISEATEACKQLARDVDRLERELDSSRLRAAEAQCTYDEWHLQWKQATEGLPLQPGHGPAEATVLLDLISCLSQQLRDAGTVRARITQIDDWTAQFVQYVSDLTARLSPDLAILSVDQAAAELNARFQKATTAAAKRDVLTGQLEAERANLQTARETTEDMQREMAALCREAGCPSAEGLPQIERRSEQKQMTDREIERLESQLRSLSAGQALSDFVAFAQSLDADTIEPRIRQLDADIEHLNRELKDELGERIGATRKVLEQMDSAAAAADAAESLQDLAARVASDAREYARLKLASVILARTIESYRDAHQGPILHRAAQLFSDLTVGAFAGLREDTDDDGRPELVGIRTTTGEPVRVKHMSDGSADQLYLAIRLAWLEDFLDQHEAIPFIVDDVLIRFDDKRAVATLKAFAALSTRTQVLFFTHHQHLVECARKAVDDDLLFVHELPQFMAPQLVS